MQGPCPHPGCPDSDQSHPPSEVAVCAEELRDALSVLGITLPSLGVDLVAFASLSPHHRNGLVVLGKCNLGTARALTAALRAAAG